MSDAKREMTLGEVVGLLPEGHRAKRELKALREAASRLAEGTREKPSDAEVNTAIDELADKAKRHARANGLRSWDGEYEVDRLAGLLKSALSTPPASPAATTQRDARTVQSTDTDSLGLSIDMLDADRLRQYAQNLLTYGPDITHWASVPHVVSKLQTIANGIENAVRDIGVLRQSTPPASPAASARREQE